MDAGRAIYGIDFSGAGVWRGRATVVDSKDSGKPQKAALNGAYKCFFDPEMGLIETGPS